jgi:hypothetical protein
MIARSSSLSEFVIGDQPFLKDQPAGNIADTNSEQTQRQG